MIGRIRLFRTVRTPWRIVLNSSSLLDFINPNGLLIPHTDVRYLIDPLYMENVLEPARCSKPNLYADLHAEPTAEQDNAAY